MWVFFILFSLVLILSAIISVVAKKMIYSLLFAMVAFFMVGCLFLLCGATYNAIAQLLVYVVAVPILMAVSIMIVNDTKDKRQLFRSKHFLFSFLGILLLALVLGEFLSLNSDIFDIIKSCSVYVNSYSDLLSISKNILGVYPVLFLEFALGVLLAVIGLSNYEK